MTRLSCTTAVWLLALIAVRPCAAADEDPLLKARGSWLAGKYAEAIETWQPLLADHPEAVLGTARCLREQGKVDEAAELLGEAAADRADLQAELARLEFNRGKYAQAKARADEAIRLDANQLQARWILAELDRVAGRLDEAEAGYRWLITYYNMHEVQRAESLHWIGLAAARYARWNRLDGQFGFLVNELYPDALKAEEAYWPALYESGVLFLEKYNKGDASRELKAALELNPNAAEVHVALAALAAAERKLDQAEESLDRALEINPNLLSAWLGKADLVWGNFDVHGSLELLRKKALPLNPRSEETLGRIAGCYVLLDGMPEEGDATRLTRLIDHVTRLNPHAGDFFFALGAQ